MVESQPQPSALVPLDELDVIGPDTYSANGYPHAAWKRLREESPVHWFDLEGGVGFWAVTRRPAASNSSSITVTFTPLGVPIE